MNASRLDEFQSPMKSSGQPDTLPDARGLRVALVVSRFNPVVTQRLRDGAMAALTTAGASTEAIEVFDVPGAFEIPFAAQRVAETGRFDAVVCLGCVIRGSTPHFEYINAAVSHGITAAAAHTGVPMAFGVLTTNTPDEALERAAPDRTNKGWEAALAAIEMAHFARRLSARRQELQA
jgi:6,7-dimethyl-8-ribityllumazine synthase